MRDKLAAFMVERETYEALRKQGYLQRTSVSEQIRRAISEYLARRRKK